MSGEYWSKREEIKSREEGRNKDDANHAWPISANAMRRRRRALSQTKKKLSKHLKSCSASAKSFKSSAGHILQQIWPNIITNFKEIVTNYDYLEDERIVLVIKYLFKYSSSCWCSGNKYCFLHLLDTDTHIFMKYVLHFCGTKRVFNDISPINI